MKNAIIRFVAFLTVATSISAFAASGKTSKADKAGCNNTPSQTAAAGQEQAQCSNDAEKDRQALIDEQSTQWLRDVDYAR